MVRFALNGNIFSFTAGETGKASEEREGQRGRDQFWRGGDWLWSFLLIIRASYLRYKAAGTKLVPGGPAGFISNQNLTPVF